MVSWVFFRSPKAVVLAIILMGVGIFQLLIGWSYIGDSKKEASTVGRLVRVHHGKGSTYVYVFAVNGLRIEDDSSTCSTPLTSSGCEVGAAVLVYYNRDKLSETLLEEFGAAGRGKIFFGAWMAGASLLLFGLHFIFSRFLKSPDESDDVDSDAPVNEPEILHVVPGE